MGLLIIHYVLVLVSWLEVLPAERERGSECRASERWEKSEESNSLSSYCPLHSEEGKASLQRRLRVFIVCINVTHSLDYENIDQSKPGLNDTNISCSRSNDTNLIKATNRNSDSREIRCKFNVNPNVILLLKSINHNSNYSKS